MIRCNDCHSTYAPLPADAPPHSCAQVARERKVIIERLDKQLKEAQVEIERLKDRFFKYIP